MSFQITPTSMFLVHPSSDLSCACPMYRPTGRFALRLLDSLKIITKNYTLLEKLKITLQYLMPSFERTSYVVIVTRIYMVLAEKHKNFVQITGFGFHCTNH